MNEPKPRGDSVSKAKRRDGTLERAKVLMYIPLLVGLWYTLVRPHLHLLPPALLGARTRIRSSLAKLFVRCLLLAPHFYLSDARTCFAAPSRSRACAPFARRYGSAVWGSIVNKKIMTETFSNPAILTSIHLVSRYAARRLRTRETRRQAAARSRAPGSRPANASSHVVPTHALRTPWQRVHEPGGSED